MSEYIHLSSVDLERIANAIRFHGECIVKAAAIRAGWDLDRLAQLELEQDSTGGRANSGTPSEGAGSQQVANL